MPSAGHTEAHFLTRWRSRYITAAIVCLNTISLFVAVNLIAAGFLTIAGEAHPKSYERAWLIDAYGLDTLARNYPGLSRDELTTFLRETSNWVQAYEPYTGFRPAERHDNYITIAREGFRPTPNQAAWPPEDGTAVFLFGGSTTMGAGVPDDQTVGAHLQAALARCNPSVKLYNFGRGFYFSTQERILFEQLLVQGHRPALAVFLDGLNDFYFADGNPQFTAEFTRFMNRESGLPDDPHWIGSLAAVGRQLPVMRAAARLGLVPAAQPVAFGESPVVSGNETERVNAVLTRWETNRKLTLAAAQSHEVRAAFVWQPVPTYGYDIRNMTVYRDGTDLFGAHRLSGIGYPSAEMRYRDATGVLWLGDMQRNRAENLYVDAVHYTGPFSREVATRIADFVITQDLFPCPGK